MPLTSAKVLYYISQLSPISDKALYYPYLTSGIATQGFCVYRAFKTVVQPEKSTRKWCVLGQILSNNC